MILSSVILLPNLLTSHETIYLFIKNNINTQFTYQLLWVYMANEQIISEILQNDVMSSNNWQRNNFYDLTSNFGQFQKHVQHSMLCLHHRYILSPHLHILWHTYHHHTSLSDDTYKCYIFTWTANNRLKYQLLYKKPQ